MKMIYVLLCGMTTCLFSVVINGQTAFGVKGGVNIASLPDSYKQRISVHGGIFVNRPLNKYISIQPEIFFSGEGERAHYNGAEHVWVLDYIEVPLMVQVYPIRQLYLEVGPQVGFLVNAQEKAVGGTHRDVSANFANVQFAIATGLGVKITDDIIVYGRYNFGLTDLTAYDAIEHPGKVAQIGLAFRFTTL
jgi:hypothetical protein